MCCGTSAQKRLLMSGHALQVCEHLQRIGKVCGVWAVPIVGGISPVKQERLLKKLPEVSCGALPDTYLPVMPLLSSCAPALLCHHSTPFAAQHNLSFIFCHQLAFSYKATIPVIFPGSCYQ